MRFRCSYEIGSQRRVDVHARRDAGIHLLLHERGMKVAGIDGHQAYVRHGPVALLGRGQASDDRGG